MNDKCLERLVRDSLEDGVGVRDSQLAAILDVAARSAKIRRNHRLWWRGGLSGVLAASLLLALLFKSSLYSNNNEIYLSEVIDFLCVVDDLPTGLVDGATQGEALLAWQDAPCKLMVD